MFEHHSAFDHSNVQHGFHAGRVRVVDPSDVDAETTAMKLLFPRESVMTTPMGCSHTCLYTDQTPPWLVAERMEEHLIEVEHVREAGGPIVGARHP